MNNRCQFQACRHVVATRYVGVGLCWFHYQCLATAPAYSEMETAMLSEIGLHRDKVDGAVKVFERTKETK